MKRKGYPTLHLIIGDNFIQLRHKNSSIRKQRKFMNKSRKRRRRLYFKMTNPMMRTGHLGKSFREVIGAPKSGCVVGWGHGVKPKDIFPKVKGGAVNEAILKENEELKAELKTYTKKVDMMESIVAKLCSQMGVDPSDLFGSTSKATPEPGNDSEHDEEFDEDDLT